MDSNIDASFTQNITYKYVSRKLIPKGKITLEYAKRCLTLDESGKLPTQKLEELKLLKRCSRDYFRNEVEAMMIDECQTQGINCSENQNIEESKRLVTNMTALRLTIKHNYSHSYFLKLFQVSTGIFDRNDDWAKNLEKKYMNGKGLRYTETSRSTHASRDKGCFKILAWNVKSEIIKQFQAIGRANHGFYLTLNLPNDEKGKRVQREKGKWYDAFIKHYDGAKHCKYNLEEDNIEKNEQEDSRFERYDQEEEKNQDVDKVTTNMKKLNDTLQVAKNSKILDKIDLDNYMLDDSRNVSNEENDGMMVTSHLKTPTGDILFFTNNQWVDYAKAAELCGRDSLTDYIMQNNVSQIYGKAARSHNEITKVGNDLKKMKRKRNELKTKLNKAKKMRETSSSEKTINISSHMKTAAGTIYDVQTEEGTTVKIPYKSLMTKYPNEVEKYNKTQVEEGNEEEEISVTKIIKHKRVGKQYHFLLQFSDGTEEYATENEARIDCKKLLEAYKKKNFQRKKTNVVLVKHSSFRCKNDHTKIESYKGEGNCKYFGMGQMLWNAKCRKCKIVISGENGDGDIFRPTLRCPAYTCTNHTQGCKESLCNPCAKVIMLSGENRGTRRTRNKAQ